MCSVTAEFSFLQKKTAFWCSFKRVQNWRLVSPIYSGSQSLHSPDYPDILGQPWRHEAIVSRENGGPFSTQRREWMLFPVSHSVHPTLSGRFFDLALRRRICGHFGSERAQTVLLSLNFLVSSDEIDAILRSTPKVSKENALFFSICVFLLSCLHFLLVLVLLKFHHGQFHARK